MQSKGGVGKSYLAQMLALKADKEKKDVSFVDIDNSTDTLKRYFTNRKANLKEGLEDLLSFIRVDILDKNGDIDKDKFDKFIELLINVDDAVVDFGAGSSDAFVNYIAKSPSIGKYLNEINVSVAVVISGGSSYNPCVDFLKKIRVLDGISEKIILVASEHNGTVIVDGKEITVSTAIEAAVQVDVIGGTELVSEWLDMLNKGITYSAIKTSTVIARGIRIMDYLEKLFAQLQKNRL